MTHRDTKIICETLNELLEENKSLKKDIRDIIELLGVIGQPIIYGEEGHEYYDKMYTNLTKKYEDKE